MNDQNLQNGEAKKEAVLDLIIRGASQRQRK